MDEFDAMYRRIQAKIQELEQIIGEATDELARARGLRFKVATQNKDTGEIDVEYMSQADFMRRYSQDYEGSLTWGEKNPQVMAYLYNAMADAADAVENNHTRMTVVFLRDE
jgi:hypothetical protein